MMKPQLIIKGDDTFFNNMDLLGSITLETDLDLTGWTAEFNLQGVTFILDDMSSKVFQPRFTKEQTSTFQCGIHYATLKLYDTQKFLRTVFTNLPYKITKEVEGLYDE